MSTVYFEYDLKKVPRVQYENYFAGLIFGILPIIASCLFDKHLLFGFPFGRETAAYYFYIGLMIFFLVDMLFLTYSYTDEDQVFRFGQNGFYWDNGAIIGKETFYRPSEKICRITFSRTGRLELTDSLGKTFTADRLKYSEQAEQQLAECFPMAWEQDIPSIPSEIKTEK
ncbi:hypothetical protein [Neisseria wadsworthii]|nr:hypothetical protein [Neisseria wadsworthii]QMT34781.1 hypothetical protein H3L96_06735 [Neisseria wadsworthii]